MSIKKWLFSRMIFRNMLATFGYRSGYSAAPGGFTAYFVYRLGDYEQNFYLYFPKEPFAIRYVNEIFNKLYEYEGFDIIRYLEFHYSLYPDKADFLRFLKYEINDRLKRKGHQQRKLNAALEWVTEKQSELHDKIREKISQEQNDLKQELSAGVQSIIQEVGTTKEANTDQQVKILVEKLSGHIDQIMKTADTELRELTNSFSTGSIELNNRNHEMLMIQLLILLKNVQAPSSLQKGEQLFKKFSDTDIAAILALHFEAFKNLKLNTLQGKARSQNELINYKSPKVKQLIQALEDFFY